MFDICRLRFQKVMATKYDKASKKKGVSKPSPSKKAKYSGDVYQKSREHAGQPKAELKGADTTAQGMVIRPTAAPPNFGLLNSVVVGAELYQRTGRKIYMKSLHFKGFIFPTQATTSVASAFLRVIIFYDAQPNGAAPGISDLLEDSASGSPTNFLSEINLNNRQRFMILREKKFIVGPTTNTTNYGQSLLQDGSQCLVIDEFIKLKRLETCFNAVNGGTIADITTGSLYVVALCDNTSTSGAWTLSYNARVRYYD